MAFYRCYSTRPVTLAVLAMLAGAALNIAAALERARGSGPAGQVPLTRNEIAHLLSVTAIPAARGTAHRMRWSTWRRRHQYRARTCHYKRQAAQDDRP